MSVFDFSPFVADWLSDASDIFEAFLPILLVLVGVNLAVMVVSGVLSFVGRRGGSRGGRR